MSLAPAIALVLQGRYQIDDTASPPGVRAVQGHSVEVEVLALAPVTSAAALPGGAVHVTSEEGCVLRAGLSGLVWSGLGWACLPHRRQDSQPGMLIWGIALTPRRLLGCALQVAADPGERRAAAHDADAHSLCHRGPPHASEQLGDCAAAGGQARMVSIQSSSQA